MTRPGADPDPPNPTDRRGHRRAADRAPPVHRPLRADGHPRPARGDALRRLPALLRAGPGGLRGGRRRQRGQPLHPGPGHRDGAARHARHDPGRDRRQPREPLRVRRRAAHRRPAGTKDMAEIDEAVRVHVRPARRVGPDRRARRVPPRSAAARSSASTLLAELRRLREIQLEQAEALAAADLERLSVLNGERLRRAGRASSPTDTPAAVAGRRSPRPAPWSSCSSATSASWWSGPPPRATPCAPSSAPCAPAAPRSRGTAPPPPAARSTSTVAPLTASTGVHGRRTVADESRPGGGTPCRSMIRRVPGPPTGGDPHEGPRGRRQSGASRAHRLARRDRPQRLVRVEPRGGRPVRAARPRGAGSGSGTTPWRCCAACRRTRSTPPPPTRASWRWWPASRAASTPTSTSRAGCSPPHADAQDMLVAYFSLEFGLDAGIPLYSGGLGILAGDHLKSASDLGVPLVGVGLLYRSGYFRQQLGPDGGQRERYPATDWSDLPARRPDRRRRRARDRRGAGGRRPGAGGRAPHPGGPRAAAAARRRHRRPTRDEAREITSTLYGGDRERRIRQEILLGVGGVRALAAAGHGADGLPHERGPLGAAGAGAHPRAHRRRRPQRRRRPRAGDRLDGLHHPHARARRQRDVRPRAGAPLPRAAWRRRSA